jgi:cytosine/adenosine deaminase-related metal-dependent hydrolase
MLLAARHVVPSAGDVLSGGFVAWRDGRLTSVGTERPPGGERAVDLGDAVLLPGLVNAHAHLELTALRGEVPLGEGFLDWIPRLTRQRRAAAEATLVAGARAGVSECVAAGTVAVGDIVSVDACAAPLLRSGLRGVCYLETLGPTAERARDAAAALPGRLAAADAQGGAMGVGLSPHTPWTVTRALFEAARTHGAGRRFAVHVAESREELRFCHHGDGPLRDAFAAWGVDLGRLPPPMASPVAYLEALGLLGPTTLCIHANYVDDDDVARLARTGAPVAFCPRSHAFFRHGLHPVRALLAAGVVVALGTDSVASNDTLSIRDEMAFLLETRADLSPDTILDLATRGGAQALGTGPGVLAAGAPADCVAVALPPGSGDPLERVVAGEGEVILTVAGGRVLHDTRGLWPRPPGAGDPDGVR